MSDGFRTHVTYSDSNVDNNFDGHVFDFLIRPIDNLKRDGSTQKIQSLPENVSQESYIPLNLMQMTKKEFLEELSSVDNMTNVESFNNFGEIDSSNTFPQYFFAEIQNKYQMKCLKKCGLRVKMQNYDPAITKFSRIWVDIYDDHPISSYQVSKDERAEEFIKKNSQSDYTTEYREYIDRKNDNIINFEDEGVLDIINDGIGPSNYWPKEKYNRSLSGWYVVTEIELEYDHNDNNIRMNLTLNRIEYQPVFKSDYELAKKAVEIYKEHNLVEDIFKTM